VPRTWVRLKSWQSKGIGIDCSGRGYHTYRHTFGTNLFRSGVPIQTASVLLGHSDISVTQKYYVHVNQAEKELAVLNLSKFATKLQENDKSQKVDKKLIKPTNLHVIYCMKKAPKSSDFKACVVAGEGFEPTTSGL